jgi:UDP-2-acetamido-2,6-beta-L-arabino-hexul-4-ose reductase
MIKIGITGQNGFIGYHLFNTLRIFPEEFTLVHFERSFFEEELKLIDFIKNCDVIVHLAALNRHNDPDYIFDTNILLVKKLVSALNASDNKPHVIFSSSSQENRVNAYGKSKKAGREILSEWAKESGAKFTGLLIPNVFGPFGNPYYNSFISTFSHQLSHDEHPKIDTDSEVKLIYVGDLVAKIVSEIRGGIACEELVIEHTNEKKVSEILRILEVFKDQYLQLGIIPKLSDRFELNLFNTFRSYINLERYPIRFSSFNDPRGSFVEIAKLNIGGQVSFSTTLPGITRGNHYHTRKIERFAVIKGKALIELRKIGTPEVFEFYLDGNEPSFVDMPIWFTHNIKNIGEEELYTIFWINEFYDQKDPDTFFEIV